jgi:protein-tyrosine-phosphatase
MAESYMLSKKLNTSVISSGTMADSTRELTVGNLNETNNILKKHKLPLPKNPSTQFSKAIVSDDDYLIFVNNIAYQEAKDIVDFNNKYEIWDIADIDEVGANKPATNKSVEYFDIETLKLIKNKVNSLIVEQNLQEIT